MIEEVFDLEDNDYAYYQEHFVGKGFLPLPFSLHLSFCHKYLCLTPLLSPQPPFFEISSQTTTEHLSLVIQTQDPMLFP